MGGGTYAILFFFFFLGVGGRGGVLSMRVTLFEGLSRDSTLGPYFSPFGQKPEILNPLFLSLLTLFYVQTRGAKPLNSFFSMAL